MANPKAPFPRWSTTKSQLKFSAVGLWKLLFRVDRVREAILHNGIQKREDFVPLSWPDPLETPFLAKNQKNPETEFKYISKY